MGYKQDLNYINKVINRRRKDIIVEDPADEKERLLCEEKFYEFIKHAFHTIEGDKQFIEGWHLLAICGHLELTLTGQIEFLIINMPPGYMKSLIVICFNAWLWTKDSSLKFLHLSYSHELSKQHNSSFRKLITSEWYQKHWGKKFKIIKENESEVSLSTPGKRISSSVESSFITGKHYHFIILDDANSAADAHVKSITDRINYWYDTTLISRLLPGGVRINLQQRLTEQDLTSHIQSKNLDNVVTLYLPEEFIPEDRCETVEINGKMWCDPRTEKGELLWPQFKTPEIVAKTKRELPSRVWWAQYQQKPQTLDGQYFFRKHFQIYSKEFMPDFQYVIQSWDTALKVGDNNCYSACSTWGVFEDEYGIPQFALVSTFRDRVSGNQLYNVARNMAYDYYNDAIEAPFKDVSARRPKVVLIEDKVNGTGLIEDLLRSGVNVLPFNPRGDKRWRAIRASILIESKRVWLMAKPSGELYKFSEEFLNMAVGWPDNKDGTDLIDTMTQALIFILEHSDIMPTSFVAHQKYKEFRTPA